MNAELVEYLSQFAHDNRVELFNEKIKERTDYVTLVLEDIFHAQNTSAAIRTCDCFAIQNIHVIENRNEFNLHTGITLGSANWVDIHQYNEKENNTKACLDKLKSEGYKIVATTPLPDAPSLYELNLDEKVALVLGNEAEGISDIVKQEADELVTIPMYGFTESFNISVSAAVCLSELTSKIRTLNLDWQLDEDEKNRILTKWLRQSIKHGDKLIEEFYTKNNE
ncbi:MAG: TrmH family RNA methyltransferase [Flavobacteriales bacterium]